MPELFETTVINGMTLRNRFVRSATWLGAANPDGSCTQKLIDATSESARHGIGLVITGYGYVTADGQAAPFQFAANSDENIPDLTRLAGAVHEAGAPVALQIMHGGLMSIEHLTHCEVVGPSPCSVNGEQMGREMTSEEIDRVVAAFGEAAERAKTAGFDAVQIHAAHGFLLGQFLSPYFNRRSDDYGGPLEARARILLEAVRAVREGVGPDYPVLVKINATDSLEGGVDSEQMVPTCVLLEQAGVDAIEISGGTMLAYYTNTYAGFFAPPFKEGTYYENAARKYREQVKLPLMLVGGIRTYQQSEALVKEGVADYVSLSRSLVRQPDLIERWQAGERVDSQCVSDNACLVAGIKGHHVHCVHLGGYRKRGGKLRFYSALSGAVNTNRAVAECMENALGADSTDCDLLVFYTTMGHDFNEILAEVHRLAPSAKVAGCTCAGVIGREGTNETMRGLAVMALRGPQDAVAVAGAGRIRSDQLHRTGAELASALKGDCPNLNMVLCHPSHSVFPTRDLLRGMESVLGTDVPIVGGMSLDSMKFLSSFQFVDSQTFEQGVIAIGLGDPSLEVVTAVNHGFQPIGAPVNVTRSDRNRVIEIDGAPAWQVLTGLLGVPRESLVLEIAMLAQFAEEIPEELVKEYGSKYLLVGGALREPDDSITFAVECPPGTPLRLLQRDEDGITRGVDRVAQQINDHCNGRRPVAVFHADCGARGKRAFNRILKEEIVNRLQQPILDGENIPWLGMYGGGELTPLGGRNEIHTYTSSVYAIVEKERP